MRYQAALRPDLAAASRQRYRTRQGGRGKRVAQRRRKSKRGKWLGAALTTGLAVPAAYLLAALIGSLIPVNDRWVEPQHGTTIYIADNGVHADLIMPVRAQGLDWLREFPRRNFALLDGTPQWIAFGSGERHVYLDTPSWSAI